MFESDGGKLASARIGRASASHAMNVLLNFVVGGTIPLPIALALFDSKVEGRLAYGRWLYCLAEGCLDELNDLYDGWARPLLGAMKWGNAAVVK